MTIVYEMATGSIRSGAQQENRKDQQQDKRPEVMPDTPAPALQEFEPTTQPEPTSIHLIRELLKKG